MPTAAAKRTIFREKAVQKYLQGREKSVLPRIVAPPVFLFCWLLLAVLTAIGLVSWLGQVPLYVSGSGVVLTTNTMLPPQGSDEAMAAVLLPASQSELVRRGLPVQVQVGQAGPQLMRTVDYVSPAILSPSDVRRQFGLTTSDPTLVLLTRLGPDIPRHIYAGSAVQVQVRVGSRRLLSLFPLFDSLLKDA